MADLDDFFAKKDRKKAKGKKFTTTEEIAKKLEETGKKLEKPKPKEKPPNTEGGDDNQPIEVKVTPGSFLSFELNKHIVLIYIPLRIFLLNRL